MTSTQIDETEIRIIDDGAAPTRFARGWHCLGLADSFRGGKPHPVEAFGTKLVVFADSTGTLKILDAYCRHMGGDLSQGAIKGDTVACPFHDWRWGGDGRCKDIPYARRVPPLARTRSWAAMEQDDLLFVWNDPEGNPPPPEVAVPVMRTADAEWTEWVWKSLTIDTNCREIIDNVVDMAHFFYVHLSFPVYFKNVFENHVAVQYFEGRSREDVRPKVTDGSKPNLVASHSTAAYYGPSFMIDELDYEYDTMTLNSVLATCHYPVSANKFVLMYGVTVKKTPELLGDEAVELARNHSTFISQGFEQDVAIWKNKTRINNPLLSAEDGPVYQLRRWHEQFYVDVADITPDMVARFEFEMDTSKAVESWTKEVQANIVRQVAENPVG
ncbi:Rieske 2Fe-2S domain-containing protein [Rhodococcus globerulus]|uniref:Rieske 2Fe-2S domain-containing protein n=1 Tax=Rhodococcus globerulus TaxID=33008 RepID=UPI001FCFBBA0|nr:Rieske 2Fe-2S domain-containing protein [Rhodococcus globerulus]